MLTWAGLAWQNSWDNQGENPRAALLSGLFFAYGFAIFLQSFCNPNYRHKKRPVKVLIYNNYLARPARLERATYGLEGMDLLCPKSLIKMILSIQSIAVILSIC